MKKDDLTPEIAAKATRIAEGNIGILYKAMNCKRVSSISKTYDTDDIESECYYRYWIVCCKKAKGELKCELHTAVYNLVKYAICNFYRRRTEIKSEVINCSTVPIDSECVEGATYAEVLPDKVNVEKYVENKMMCEKVKQALDEVCTEKEREVMLLTYKYDSVRSTEISEAVGISRQRVKQLRYEASKKIRKWFDEDYVIEIPEVILNFIGNRTKLLDALNMLCVRWRDFGPRNWHLRNYDIKYKTFRGRIYMLNSEVFCRYAENEEVRKFVDRLNQRFDGRPTFYTY